MILSCPACGGKGVLNFHRCKNCRGLGFGRFRDTDFFYWGEEIDEYGIGLRRGRRILTATQILLALFFVIGGWGLFFWRVYSLDLWTSVFELSYWISGGDHYRILFWLGSLALFFIFYLISNYRPKEETVRRFPEEEEKTPDYQWEYILKLPKKKKVDISLAFSHSAKKIIEDAHATAADFGDKKIELTHLFYSLLSLSEVAMVFVRLELPVKTIKNKISAILLRKNEKSDPILSDEVKKVLFSAYDKAGVARMDKVGPTELLSAVMDLSFPLQDFISQMGVEKEKMDNVIEWARLREKIRQRYFRLRRSASFRSKHGIDRAMTAVATPFLNGFSEDLTLMAKYGHHTPCVARDREIKEMFGIIESGRQSVILVGDHGVGKMTMISGMADRMIEDHVPSRLKDKRLVQLSVSSLLAGTTVAGARDRILRLMEEVRRAGNVILFINGIHNLIGAEESGEKGLDLSETLAEYMNTGNFLVLATATPDGYNRLVLNTALSKSFAKVEISEMDEDQTIKVLESRIGSIEYHQNVFFTYSALEETAKLTRRFWHDGKLPESAINVATEAAAFTKNKKGQNTFVTSEEVAHIISQKTGIPTSSISDEESVKLLRLEQEMHRMVVGQDEAVALVANALRRARADIRAGNRPIANFLFLGPTGVGKTELAKTIAKVYFGGEERMIRADMSEYQDSSAVYRLIGNPGKQGTGFLTEAVRQKPFSLVLLDELEKADNNLLNIFLQVFDDGRLTDSVGRVIDFTNTIIIATSNAGTSWLQDRLRDGAPLEQIRRELIEKQLKEFYRPEFLNRFDGIVLFKPLTQEEIKEVAKIMLSRMTASLAAKGVEFVFSEDALSALSEIGYDPEFGARPMRRVIQDKVENGLAELIIGKRLGRGAVVKLNSDLTLSVN